MSREAAVWRLQAALVVAVLLAASFAALVSAERAPAWDVAWSDDFERSAIGAAWEMEEGEVTIENGSARLVNDHDHARFQRMGDEDVGDGTLEFRWTPVQMAPRWKELQVAFRYMEPSKSARQTHHVDFNLDDNTICGHAGISGGCVPYQWEARWYHFNITHWDGEVAVRIDGERVFRGSYDPEEPVTRVTFLAADDGTGQYLDDIVYWTTTARRDAAQYGVQRHVTTIHHGGTYENTAAVSAGPAGENGEHYALSATLLAGSHEVARVYTGGALTESASASTPESGAVTVPVGAWAEAGVTHWYDEGTYVCFVEVLGDMCLLRVPPDFTDPAWISNDDYAADFTLHVAALGVEIANAHADVPAGGALTQVLP